MFYRLGKWFFWTGVAVGAFFLLAVGFSWFTNYRIKQTIAAITAEWDQKDPGWRLEEIEASRKVLPDERNSALVVMRVKKLLGENILKEWKEFDRVFGTESLPPPAQLNEEQIKFLREFLSKHKEAVAEAGKLKDLFEGRYPITYTDDFMSTLIQNQQDGRQIGNLLSKKAFWQIQEKEIDQALETCQAILNTGRSLGDEPLLISLLIRMAHQAITIQAVERAGAQGEAKAQPLEKLQKHLELEIAELPALVLRAVKGERAGQFVICQALMNGKISLRKMAEAGGQQTGDEGDVWVYLFPSVINKYFPEFLGMVGQQVELAKLPLEEQIEAWDLQYLEIRESKNLMANLLLPAMRKVIEAAVRIKAYLQCARVGVACERFRLARGSWPRNLEELVQAKLLDALPLDPFGGQPLRLRPTKDGILIYSISLDRTDDGGAIDRDQPTAPGKDLGFRLWDPQARRQPPLPSPKPMPDDPE